MYGAFVIVEPYVRFRQSARWSPFTAGHPCPAAPYYQRYSDGWGVVFVPFDPQDVTVRGNEQAAAL